MKKKYNLFVNKQAFTLIELIIVMMIISTLALLIIGNFISSIIKGKDSKRKGDLNQIRQVVESFYEDNRAYPYLKGSAQSNLMNTSNYINSGNLYIVNNKTYINRLPADPVNEYNYRYDTDAEGTYYRLFSCIENKNDVSEGVSQTGFQGSPSCGSCVCKYTISSPNVTPLPTL